MNSLIEKTQPKQMQQIQFGTNQTNAGTTTQISSYQVDGNNKLNTEGGVILHEHESKNNTSSKENLNKTKPKLLMKYQRQKNIEKQIRYDNNNKVIGYYNYSSNPKNYSYVVHKLYCKNLNKKDIVILEPMLVMNDENKTKAPDTYNNPKEEKATLFDIYYEKSNLTIRRGKPATLVSRIRQVSSGNNGNLYLFCVKGTLNNELVLEPEYSLPITVMAKDPSRTKKKTKEHTATSAINSDQSVDDDDDDDDDDNNNDDDGDFDDDDDDNNDDDGDFDDDDDDDDNNNNNNDDDDDDDDDYDNKEGNKRIIKNAAHSSVIIDYNAPIFSLTSSNDTTSQLVSNEIIYLQLKQRRLDGLAKAIIVDTNNHYQDVQTSASMMSRNNNDNNNNFTTSSTSSASSLSLTPPIITQLNNNNNNNNNNSLFTPSKSVILTENQKYLNIACTDGTKDTVIFLLSRMTLTELNGQDPVSGYTALMLAIINKREKVAQLLLARGADYKELVDKEKGWNAKDFACAYSPAIFKILYMKDISTSSSSSSSLSPCDADAVNAAAVVVNNAVIISGASNNQFFGSSSSLPTSSFSSSAFTTVDFASNNDSNKSGKSGKGRKRKHQNKNKIAGNVDIAGTTDSEGSVSSNDHYDNNNKMKKPRISSTSVTNQNVQQRQSTLTSTVSYHLTSPNNCSTDSDKDTDINDNNKHNTNSQHSASSNVSPMSYLWDPKVEDPSQFTDYHTQNNSKDNRNQQNTHDSGIHDDSSFYWDSILEGLENYYCQYDPQVLSSSIGSASSASTSPSSLLFTNNDNNTDDNNNNNVTCSIG